MGLDFGRVWKRAAQLAERTPESRNRYVDFLRALSICAVVIGHWLVAAPYLGEGGTLVPGHLLAIEPWTRWLTLGFQVMPIFFLVGGYANGTSWEAARRRGDGYGGWLRSRVERLAAPVLPLLLAWAGASALAHALGAPAELLQTASRLALVPAWFLAAYVLIVAFVPLSHAAWQRFGVGSVVGLVAAAAVVDLLAFAGGLSVAGYANYLFVWLAIHQLGYAWRAGVLVGPRRGLAVGAVGIAALVAAVAFGPYPLAMIGVPGAAVSNSMPPTLALLALGIAQSGLVLALEGPARRLLARRRLWTGTVLVNGMIMSLYLWHMTAFVAVVGVAAAASAPALEAVPATAGWWLGRPLWLAVYALPTAVLVATFLRFEARAAAAPCRPHSKRRAVAATALVAVGLALASAGGLAAAGASLTGVRLWALAPPLVGAALAGFGPLAPGPSGESR
ncbi:MAG: acyltransferase [Myxococcota bacterium]|nr:acyltransferase [Myxococcota bacterium]